MSAFLCMCLALSYLISSFHLCVYASLCLCLSVSMPLFFYISLFLSFSFSFYLYISLHPSYHSPCHIKSHLPACLLNESAILYIQLHFSILGAITYVMLCYITSRYIYITYKKHIPTSDPSIHSAVISPSSRR